MLSELEFSKYLLSFSCFGKPEIGGSNRRYHIELAKIFHEEYEREIWDGELISETIRSFPYQVVNEKNSKKYPRMIKKIMYATELVKEFFDHKIYSEEEILLKIAEFSNRVSRRKIKELF